MLLGETASALLHAEERRRAAIAAARRAEHRGGAARLQHLHAQAASAQRHAARTERRAHDSIAASLRPASRQVRLESTKLLLTLWNAQSVCAAGVPFSLHSREGHTGTFGLLVARCFAACGAGASPGMLHTIDGEPLCSIDELLAYAVTRHQSAVRSRNFAHLPVLSVSDQALLARFGDALDILCVEKGRPRDAAMRTLPTLLQRKVALEQQVLRHCDNEDSGDAWRRLRSSRPHGQSPLRTEPASDKEQRAAPSRGPGRSGNEAGDDASVPMLLPPANVSLSWFTATRVHSEGQAPPQGAPTSASPVPYALGGSIHHSHNHNDDGDNDDEAGARRSDRAGRSASGAAMRVALMASAHRQCWGSQTPPTHQSSKPAALSGGGSNDERDEEGGTHEDGERRSRLDAATVATLFLEGATSGADELRTLADTVLRCSSANVSNPTDNSRVAMFVAQRSARRGLLGNSARPSGSDPPPAALSRLHRAAASPLHVQFGATSPSSEVTRASCTRRLRPINAHLPAATSREFGHDDGTSTVDADATEAPYAVRPASSQGGDCGRGSRSATLASRRAGILRDWQVQRHQVGGRGTSDSASTEDPPTFGGFSTLAPLSPTFNPRPCSSSSSYSARSSSPILGCASGSRGTSSRPHAVALRVALSVPRQHPPLPEQLAVEALTQLAQQPASAADDRGFCDADSLPCPAPLLAPPLAVTESPSVQQRPQSGSVGGGIGSELLLSGSQTPSTASGASSRSRARFSHHAKLDIAFPLGIRYNAAGEPVRIDGGTLHRGSVALSVSSGDLVKIEWVNPRVGIAHGRRVLRASDPSLRHFVRVSDDAAAQGLFGVDVGKERFLPGADAPVRPHLVVPQQLSFLTDECVNLPISALRPTSTFGWLLWINLPEVRRLARGSVVGRSRRRRSSDRERGDSESYGDDGSSISISNDKEEETGEDEGCDDLGSGADAENGAQARIERLVRRNSSVHHVGRLRTAADALAAAAAVVGAPGDAPSPPLHLSDNREDQDAWLDDACRGTARGFCGIVRENHHHHHHTPLVEACFVHEHSTAHQILFSPDDEQYDEDADGSGPGATVACFCCGKLARDAHTRSASSALTANAAGNGAANDSAGGDDFDLHSALSVSAVEDLVEEQGPEESVERSRAEPVVGAVSDADDDRGALTPELCGNERLALSGQLFVSQQQQDAVIIVL